MEVEVEMEMVLWYGDGFTLWGALVMVAIGSWQPRVD